MRVRALLQEHFGNTIGATPSDPVILEVQRPDTNKATGIEKLRRYLGNDQRTVITCGDYENDIPMHRAADIAIAPANAMPEVKAIATRVMCHCHDGLIADVIEAIERGEL